MPDRRVRPVTKNGRHGLPLSGRERRSGTRLACMRSRSPRRQPFVPNEEVHHQHQQEEAKEEESPGFRDSAVSDLDRGLGGCALPRLGAIGTHPK